MSDITVIGNAIIDILVGPVDKNVFNNESTPANTIKLSFGGDALNECVVLSKLGKKVDLISKIGSDEAGARIIDFINRHGIGSSAIKIDPNVETSINLVLVNNVGERYFISNPMGSQRLLAKNDVIDQLSNTGKFVSFASMFISPLLDIPSMEDIFREIKNQPERILSVDLVQEKTKSKFDDLAPLLPYIDFIMPNQDEISMLTGSDNLYENARTLLDAGCGCAVIKCGKDGCLIKSTSFEYHIPAYPAVHCIDTTGAGDSFAAGFLWALSEQWSILDCGCFASAVASCAIEQIGSTNGVHSIEQVMPRFREIKNMI